MSFLKRHMQVNFTRKEVLILLLSIVFSIFHYDQNMALADADQAPVIIVKGETEVSIQVGENYEDEGVIAYDFQQGFITQYVTVLGSVDTSTPGVYTLIYNVRDKDWNYAETKTRKVRVIGEKSIKNDLEIVSHEVKFRSETEGDILFETNKPTQAVVAYGLLGKYDNFTRPEKSFQYKKHRQPLYGISKSEAQNYKIMVKDQQGNTKSIEGYFGDDIPIVGNGFTIISNKIETVTDSSVKIRFESSDYSQAYIKYGTTRDYDEVGKKELSYRYKDHLQSLTDLAPGTIYYYKIYVIDRLQNQATKEGSFTTQGITQETNFRVLSHLVQKLTDSSVKINFESSDYSKAYIEYGTTRNYGIVGKKELSFEYKKHSQKLSNLQAGKTYYYKIHLENQLNEKIYIEGTFDTDAIQGNGTFIKDNEWDVSRSQNVKFGNHSSDKNFRQSQSGDSNAIRVRIEKGEHYGTGTDFKFPKNTQEAWVSYCVRLGDNWDPNTGGKLPGFSGNSSPANGGQGGASSNGKNAWSARGLYGIYNNSSNSSAIGTYLYHTHQSGKYGDINWWAPSPKRLFSQAQQLKKNKWHSVKQHIKMNTPGKNDGILEGWFDGEKVYSRSGINFTNNNDFREVYRFWLDVYFGGGNTAMSDHYVYFDQINYSLGFQDTTGTNCQN